MHPYGNLKLTAQYEDLFLLSSCTGRIMFTSIGHPTW